MFFCNLLLIPTCCIHRSKDVFFVYADHVYCVLAYLSIPTLARSNMYVHLRFHSPTCITYMGVDISFYRARVGLFYCICIRTKQNLSLNDIICINIMLQNGTSSLPSALLIQMFYGINTHSRNISVVMKPSPYNVKSHSNTCMYIFYPTLRLGLFYIYCYVVFIIYLLY